MTNASFDLDSPWYYINIQYRDCTRLHEIMYGYCHILPSRCLECWKVVVAPRTLAELWKLKGLMERMNRFSKCGIELRKYAGRPYGAYFYNDSVFLGRECYRIVREAVSDEISPDMPMLLKRGCTEFEREFGPTDQWEHALTPQSLQAEKLIMEYVEAVKPDPRPDHLNNRTFRLWVEHAFERGDSTWKEFCDNPDQFPLLTKPVTYHEPPKPKKVGEHA